MLPLVAFDRLDNDTADVLLDKWGHDLGPCERPFRVESWGLFVEGGVLALAFSASTVSPTVQVDPDGTMVGRRRVVECARLCAAPDARWATRVVLRLWREVAVPLWPCWRPEWLVAYAHRGRAGHIYRADGWTLVREGAGRSGGGGTWSERREPDHAAAGAKRLWVWRCR